VREPGRPFNKERLKQAREFRGWTWARLARSTEINEAIIQAMEMGWHVPDIDELFRLCRTLDFPRAFFFQDDPPQFGPTSLDYHEGPPRRRGRRDE
jgi:transcriptional regulator with XRE-family HTH domain